jgi:hypothetical protein
MPPQTIADEQRDIGFGFWIYGLDFAIAINSEAHNDYVKVFAATSNCRISRLQSPVSHLVLTSGLRPRLLPRSLWPMRISSSARLIIKL